MSSTGDVHATVSSRTRFPTVFERYSTRFGMATPNPDLDPERATNYEIGATETLFNQARISGAVFYSDLKDAIQSVYLVNGGRITSQNQNIDGEHYGFEVSVDWDIAPGLRIGGNYTYLQREYGYLTPGTQPEGTPDHEAFLYLAWEATRNTDHHAEPFSRQRSLRRDHEWDQPDGLHQDRRLCAREPAGRVQVHRKCLGRPWRDQHLR